METMVDITPFELGGTTDSKKRMFVFQENEWRQIRENPGGLTKEGILEKIKLWKDSDNVYVVAKYQTMLARCERISPSGKTSDGRIIFARKPDGRVSWAEDEKSVRLRLEKEETKKVTAKK